MKANIFWGFVFVAMFGGLIFTVSQENCDKTITSYSFNNTKYVIVKDQENCFIYRKTGKKWTKSDCKQEKTTDVVAL